MSEGTLMFDLDAISKIFTIITGIVGVIIAIQLYQFNRHQQEEVWIKVYKEIHDGFWNDPVMAKVRYWINYDRAYLEIKPILQKRKDIDDGKLSQEELLESEYKCLD